MRKHPPPGTIPASIIKEERKKKHEHHIGTGKGETEKVRSGACPEIL